MAESSRLRKLRWIHHERRPLERLRVGYALERRLRARLMGATQEERRGLYKEVYDELVASLADQPYHTQEAGYLADQRRNAMKMLGPYLREEAVYLEIGPGTGNVAGEVCRHVGRGILVDVSDAIVATDSLPENAELVLYDGVSFDVPAESVDVAYSNQMFEHIHEEDGRQHLADVYRALKPGGVYVCRTPNRYTGPHDISMFFVERPPAEGLHLKEYTYAELTHAFLDAGFRRVWAIVGARGHYVPFRVPARWMMAGERVLAALPFDLGRRIGDTVPGRVFFTMQLLGVK